MLGYQTGKALEQSISNAMCVVLPSEWYENAPLSLLEAYAYGKPVIGSNIGGIPELIEENKTGFIFETNNSDELAEKIINLSQNDDRLVQMGKLARQKVETEYNKAQFYNKTIQLYTALLNRTK
jgi:glycosyltransferase involved in cell wall biosynthesis